MLLQVFENHQLENNYLLKENHLLEEAADNEFSSPNYSQQKAKRKGQDLLRYHVLTIFQNLIKQAILIFFPIHRLFHVKKNWRNSETRVPMKIF